MSDAERPAVPAELVTLTRDELGRYVATPAVLAYVRELAAGGHTNVSIAEAIGVHRDTFREMTRRDPDLAEALARGRAALEVELTHILLEQARGGNVIAGIFLAKARCGWREGEARDAQGTVNVTIQLPAAAASVDDYVRTLPAAPGEGDDR